MGRGMLVAVSGAVVAGSVGGGLAALHAPGPPAPAMSLAAPPPDAMSPAAPPPASRALLVEQMQAVLARFAEWSRDHAGAQAPAGTAAPPAGTAAPPAQTPLTKRGKDRSHARDHRPSASTLPPAAAPLDAGADDIPARR